MQLLWVQAIAAEQAIAAAPDSLLRDEDKNAPYAPHIWPRLSLQQPGKDSLPSQCCRFSFRSQLPFRKGSAPASSKLSDNEKHGSL
jgi:hypothetical protein